MTCFSIHKKLRLFLALLLIGLGAGAYIAVAYAGNDDGAEATQETAQEGDEDTESLMPESDDPRAVQRVDAPIVVELYTASDCQSCVFADRMLYDASLEKNVIALSCHVTDLDTVDKKGKVQSTAKPGPMDPCVFRQWTYSARQVMSNPDEVAMKVPTFIFNGDDRVGARDLDYFTSALNSYRYVPKNKTIEALVRWKDNDTLSIMLPERINKRRKKIVTNASVWLVRYKDMKVEKINEGINKGRVLRFSNIIQDIQHIGKWYGKVRTIEIDVPPPQGGKEKGGYVVLVSEMLGERILVAGKVEDYPMAVDLKRPPAVDPTPQAPVSKPSADIPLQAPTAE